MNSNDSAWGQAGQQGEGERPARPNAWLAGLLLSRPRVRDRFLWFYDRLRSLPRGARRRLAHKAAIGLAGAALMLALTGAPAYAANISVVNGEVNINDNDKCSLREAIINANNNAATHNDCAAGSGAADTITLPNNGNFVVNTSFVDFYGPTGLPLIDSRVIIVGNNSTISRPNTAPNLRFLGVTPSGVLGLHDVTFRRGNVANQDGGAIHVFLGELGLNGVTIENSRATGDGNGGAIANFGGVVTVRYASLLTGNEAGDEGGAIYSVIDRNYETGGEVLVRQSTISSNEAALGGGIAMADYGQVYDYDYVDNTWLTLDQATISDNSADKGGGLHLYRNYGDVLITASTISGNSATTEGGGIYAGFPHLPIINIVNSTISGNSAEFGGGIKNEEASVFLLNTTVTGNSATGAGGGLYRFGGGIISVERSIVSGNSAPFGPNTWSDSCCEVNSKYTIFGHGGDAGTYVEGEGEDPLDPTDIVPSQALAQLLNTTLQNAGGHTDVHLLPSGSVALDAALEAECTAAPVSGKDQRNKGRNVNAVAPNNSSDCDRGAVERQPFTNIWAAVMKTPILFDLINIQPNDIIANDGAGWSLFFDGRAAGLPAKARLAAIDIPDFAGDDALMSFAATTAVPGLGRVPANDVARFDGNAFQPFFDGSDVGLSTSSERIDGLDVLPGRYSPVGSNCLHYLRVSTVGGGSVPGGGGAVRFSAADVLGFCARAVGATTRGVWHLALDASAEGAPGDATTSLAAGVNGDVYLTAGGDFFVDNAAGRNPSLIYLWQSGRFIGPEIIPADNDLPAEIVAFDVGQ